MKCLILAALVFVACPLAQAADTFYLTNHYNVDLYYRVFAENGVQVHEFTGWGGTEQQEDFDLNDWKSGGGVGFHHCHIEIVNDWSHESNRIDNVDFTANVIIDTDENHNSTCLAQGPVEGKTGNIVVAAPDGGTITLQYKDGRLTNSVYAAPPPEPAALSRRRDKPVRP